MKQGLIFSLLKLVLFAVLVPVIFAVTHSFMHELNTVNRISREHFYSGMLIFTISFFFVYDFDHFHRYSQKLVSEMTDMITPAMRKLRYIFPLFTMLAVTSYFVLDSMHKMGGMRPLWHGLIGFTLAMHFILLARELYEDDHLPLKPHYFLGMSLIFILVMLLVAGSYDLIVSKFSFSNFLENSWELTQEYYDAILNWKF